MIANQTRGTVLATDVRWAITPWARFVGLIGQACLPRGAALVFPGERWVHTQLMRFPIDVVFYDRGGVVLSVTHALPPWRFSALRWRAAGAIELPAGTAQETETQAGDRLAIPERGSRWDRR